jgi:hypothetical protein
LLTTRFAQHTPGHERECEYRRDGKPIHIDPSRALQRDFKLSEAVMAPIHWGATDTIEDGLTLNNAPAVCRVARTFPATAAMAREMDFPTRTAKERAAHYEQEADKFRRMAEAEPVEHIRQELLAVAEQYQKLADSLDNRQRLKSAMLARE